MTSKRASLYVVFVFIAGWAFPSEAQFAHSGRTVGELVDELRDFDASFRAAVVSTNRPAGAVLIPAAGNTPGAGGTHFRTDLSLINYRTSQRVEVAWMPSGANNCNNPTRIIDLGSGWRYYDDFVGKTLNARGLGALLIVGVTAAGAVDPNARIDAVSRIWTLQPNASGSVSMPFPGVSASDLSGAVRTYIIGLRHDAQYRTNVGVVNLDSSGVPQRFVAEIYGLTTQGPGTATFDVPSCSMAQVGVPAGNWGPLLASVIPQGTPGMWSAYGATVDNLTGDGWIVQAIRE